MTSITCSKCNRALNPGDADNNGECVICAPPKKVKAVTEPKDSK